MTQKTATKLNSLNRSFYKITADSFDRTRSYYWQGWTQLKEILDNEKFIPSNVVDIGCGNARFLDFLNEVYDKPAKYAGIDFSKDLLDKAKEKHKAQNARFLELDIVTKDISSELSTREFDLTVVFGVMHHIPRQTNRINLAKKLVNITQGYLVLTFWQFADKERYSKRFIDWSNVNLEQSDVEPGDYLLDWQKENLAYRYCHYWSDKEIEQMVKMLDLQVVASYKADSKTNDMNHYLIIKT